MFTKCRSYREGWQVQFILVPKERSWEEQIKDIPYTYVIGSLMYAQVCKRPDISFVVWILGTCKTNQGLDHWRPSKKFLRYLRGTKDYMLMYKRSDDLEVIGYSNSDFGCCVDSHKSTSGYIFVLAGGSMS